MYNSALLDSWSFFKNHIFSISILILPIVIPLEIITSLYEYNLTNDETGLTEELLPMLLSISLYPIYSVAVVLYISSTISGNKLNIKEIYSLALNYWLRYLIIIFVIGFLFVGGLMLFIIPGIIFIIRYSFTEFELILSNEKPFNAMRNSWEMTKEYTSTLLIGYIIISLCLYAPSVILYILLEESGSIHYSINIISNILYAVLNVIFTIFAYRIYGFSKQNITNS